MSTTPLETLIRDKNVLEYVKSKGFTSLYPPQEEALRKGLLDGKNLVIASSTASGKTLIAEMAIIKRITTGRGKAVFLVPLRAIAFEKYNELKLMEKWGIKVGLSTGDYTSPDHYLGEYDLIITTYEKMDSLLRHGASWVNDITLLVADEIHYIDDTKRGPVLEVLLSRFLGRDAQVIGLSATINNVDEIAQWLNANIVKSSWRPVPLREAVFARYKLFYNDGSFRKVREVTGIDLVDVALEVLSEGGQVLVFTSSRSRAVMLAKKLAEKLQPYIDLDSDKLSSIVDDLRSSSEAYVLNEQLASLARSGVIYHHAGLSMQQRTIIENSFRNNILKVIVATPTLAAGVNLPARRVIVEDYKRYEVGRGRVPIRVLEYKQFAGRAGRPGYDPYGETIIMASSQNEAKRLLEKYVKAEPETISSKLGIESALRSQVLALTASSRGLDLDSLLTILSKTLYARQFPLESLKYRVTYIIDFLVEENFLGNEGTMFKATDLGRKVSLLYLDPLGASMYIKGLRKTTATTPSLLLLALIVLSPDMPKVYASRREWRMVDDAVEYYAGYSEDILDYIMMEAELSEHYYSVMKTALILEEWINEESEDTISSRHNIGPGDIHSIVETASWLSKAMYELAVKVMPERASKLRVLSERVRYGVKEELLELVKIPGIGRTRARRLYQHGFRSFYDLERASINEIAKVPSIGPTIAKNIKEYLKHTSLL